MSTVNAECPMCGWDKARVWNKTWLVTIEANYSSQNDLGGNGKSGYSYRAYRNKLSQLLQHKLSAVPAADKFRAGLITRHYGLSVRGVTKRRYDEENLVGGGKPLVDVLRDYAVILNDNESAWKGYYKQEKSVDGVDRISITLME